MTQELAMHLFELADVPRMDDDRFLKSVIANSARDFLRAYCVKSNREEPLSDEEVSTNTDDTDLLLEQLLSQLTPAQRMVTEIFYGLKSKKSVRVRTISEITGYSRGEVTQLLRSGLEKLRNSGSKRSR
jgi:DNA-directed RNA polymerase sigma subunit (sigma70/sigma32)